MTDLAALSDKGPTGVTPGQIVRFPGLRGQARGGDASGGSGGARTSRAGRPPRPPCDGHPLGRRVPRNVGATRCFADDLLPIGSQPEGSGPSAWCTWSPGFEVGVGSERGSGGRWWSRPLDGRIGHPGSPPRVLPDTPPDPNPTKPSMGAATSIQCSTLAIGASRPSTMHCAG